MSKNDPTRPVTIADLTQHEDVNRKVIELQLEISSQQLKIMERFEENDAVHKDLMRGVSSLAKELLDMKGRLMYFIMPLVAIIPTAITAYVSFNK